MVVVAAVAVAAEAVVVGADGRSVAVHHRDGFGECKGLGRQLGRSGGGQPPALVLGVVDIVFGSVVRWRRLLRRRHCRVVVVAHHHRGVNGIDLRHQHPLVLVDRVDAADAVEVARRAWSPLPHQTQRRVEGRRDFGVLGA